MNTKTTTPSHAANRLAALALAQAGYPATMWRGAVKASARAAWGEGYLFRVSYFRPCGHHHYRADLSAAYHGDDPARALAELIDRATPTPEERLLRAEREHLYRRMLAMQEAGAFEGMDLDAIAHTSDTPMDFAAMNQGDIAFWREVLDMIDAIHAGEPLLRQVREEAGLAA
jgi:hypothetical protein